MTYILDSSALKYLLDELPHNLIPEIWDKFEELCQNDLILSDREIKKELELDLNDITSLEWIDKHKNLFKPLSSIEAVELGNMISKGLFDYFKTSSSTSKRIFERKLPEGIPFIIAKAKTNKYTLVYRKNGRDTNRIVSICSGESIDFCEVEEMLLALK